MTFQFLAIADLMIFYQLSNLVCVCVCVCVSTVWTLESHMTIIITN